MSTDTAPAANNNPAPAPAPVAAPISLDSIRRQRDDAVKGLLSLHENARTEWDRLQARNEELEGHASQYGIDLSELADRTITATPAGGGGGGGGKSGSVVSGGDTASSRFIPMIEDYAKLNPEFSVRSMMKEFYGTGKAKQEDQRTIIGVVLGLVKKGRIKNTGRKDDGNQTVFAWAG